VKAIRPRDVPQRRNLFLEITIRGAEGLLQHCVYKLQCSCSAAEFGSNTLQVLSCSRKMVVYAETT